MEFHLFHIITFLMLVIVGTNGAILPPQLYWKSMLPNTPMPKAITNLLYSEKSTWVDLRYEGNGAEVNDRGPLACPRCPFQYFNPASESQLQDKSNVTIFFLEKDLHQGKKLKMQFKKTTSNNNGAKFLPREVVNSIPFSSNKLETILDKLSIKKGSKEAEIVKNTISECEEKGIKGEEKICVTSLESMVDFIISKLGKNVEVVSTEVKKESSDVQQYVIGRGVEKLAAEKNKVAVCHRQNYPYAVFYCHKTDKTEVYSIPLEGFDGNRIKVVIVCHTDTSQWNPKHLAFQVLNVQPGTVPVCHFIPQDDHFVWISK